MSDTPVITAAPAAPYVAPLTPGVSKWFNYFNVIALNTAASVAQAQQDMSKGEHMQAINDVVSGAAGTAAQLFPAEAPLISLSLSGFALGEMLLEAVVGLFHHSKANVAPSAS